MNELALFAGAGGGILGGQLLGWRTVCAVELNAYAASVLLQRQNDGCLQPFPVWDDIRTFDGRPWLEIVDVVSGGFPCQDISAAGKGAGIAGARSGLWKEFARIIREVRPSHVFVENSPMLTSRGLDTILGDLAALGYDAEWGVLGAIHAGAPHKRDRIWVLGHSRSIGRNAIWDDYSKNDRTIAAADGEHTIDLAYAESIGGWAGLCQDRPVCNRDQSCDGGRDDANAMRTGREKQHAPWVAARQGQHPRPSLAERGEFWWATEPDVGRVAHGVAARVDRLTAIGNGQVPAVAALAWNMLKKQFKS